jgi:DNA-binding XRE family transcriptional regulator
MAPDLISVNSNNQSDRTNKKYQPPKQVAPEHEALMMKIGGKLVELRKEKKISASQLAKDMRISRNAYHNMEAGKSYFNFLQLLLVLDYHSINALDFFSDLKSFD